ncbi:hypothetical protein CC79DRAFT_362933 [Sarocladium strictum]
MYKSSSFAFTISSTWQFFLQSYRFAASTTLFDSSILFSTRTALQHTEFSQVPRTFFKMPVIRKFTPLDAELPDAHKPLISNQDRRRMEHMINKKPGHATKGANKNPKANKKPYPAKDNKKPAPVKEEDQRKGKKPQSAKGSAPKAQVQKQEEKSQSAKDSAPKDQVQKQDILNNAGPVKTPWSQYQSAPLGLKNIQKQQEQEKLSAVVDQAIAEKEKLCIVTEEDIAQQTKLLDTIQRSKKAQSKKDQSKKARAWHENDGVVDYKSNPSLSLPSVPDISPPASSAGSSTYRGSETESVDFASLETAQAWWDRAGADIVVVVRGPSGERHDISLHRDIVSRRCAWIRPHRQQKQKTFEPKVSVIHLDMDIAEAEACFCFTYTGGQTGILLRNKPSGVSAGQVMLQGCAPNRKDVFDLSSISKCLRLYGAALRLQMPELCRHLLKQMETLASNMGESACIHRHGSLYSNIFGTSEILQAAMIFMYTQLGQDQWRPMRIAFAGLYDAISLRVGPYLTFSITSDTQLLVERLHRDHIEYRQLQQSCIPEHGSLVASLKEMDTTVKEKGPDPFYYDAESYRQTYQEGEAPNPFNHDAESYRHIHQDASMDTLCKILPSMDNEREAPQCTWD